PSNSDYGANRVRPICNSHLPSAPCRGDRKIRGSDRRSHQHRRGEFAKLSERNRRHHGLPLQRSSLLCRSMSKKRGFSPSSSSLAPSLAPSPLRTGLEGLPSSGTPLLRPSPLRTVHASFPARGSSTANAFRETRLRDGKVLTVNPVVALRMK